MGGWLVVEGAIWLLYDARSAGGGESGWVGEPCCYWSRLFRI